MFIPQIKGTLYALIPIVLFVYFILNNLRSYINPGITYDKNDDQFDSAQINAFSNGRTGFILMFFSVLVMMYGASMINPIPDEDELNIIKKNQRVVDDKEEEESGSDDSD